MSDTQPDAPELTLDDLRAWLELDLDRLGDELCSYKYRSNESRAHIVGQANALYRVQGIIESGRLPE